MPILQAEIAEMRRCDECGCWCPVVMVSTESGEAEPMLVQPNPVPMIVPTNPKIVTLGYQLTQEDKLRRLLNHRDKAVVAPPAFMPHLLVCPAGDQAILTVFHPDEREELAPREPAPNECPECAGTGRVLGGPMNEDGERCDACGGAGVMEEADA